MHNEIYQGGSDILERFRSYQHAIAEVYPSLCFEPQKFGNTLGDCFKLIVANRVKQSTLLIAIFQPGGT